MKVPIISIISMVTITAIVIMFDKYASQSKILNGLEIKA